MLDKRRWSDDVMELWSGTLPSVRLPCARVVSRAIGTGLQFHLGMLEHSLDDLSIWLVVLVEVVVVMLLLVRLTVHRTL